MQTRARPPTAEPPSSSASGVHPAIPSAIKHNKKTKTPPPVLASDVLREDLAPFEPCRGVSRFWDGMVAMLYLAVGVALRFDLGVSGVSPQAGAVCLAAAAASAATAVVPFPYLWRAMVGGLVGVVVVVIGLMGGGPLALLASPMSTIWFELFRVLACVTLPAALLFRSYYRAYARGRVLLAIAIAVALPFLIQAAYLTTQGPTIARLGSALAVTAALSALVAFMPEPTTAMMAWLGDALTGLLAVDLALREFYAPHPAGVGPFAYLLTAVAFFAAMIPLGLGLFQTLATVYTREARLVDVYRPSLPHDDAEQPTSSD